MPMGIRVGFLCFGRIDGIDSLDFFGVSLGLS